MPRSRVADAIIDNSLADAMILHHVTISPLLERATSVDELPEGLPRSSDIVQKLHSLQVVEEEEDCLAS